MIFSLGVYRYFFALDQKLTCLIVIASALGSGRSVLSGSIFRQVQQRPENCLRTAQNDGSEARFRPPCNEALQTDFPAGAAVVGIAVSKLRKYINLSWKYINLKWKYFNLTFELKHFQLRFAASQRRSTQFRRLMSQDTDLRNFFGFPSYN